MNTDEIKVGQVFKDGDSRISNPYFRVDEVHNVKPKAFAKGKRFVDADCTKTRDGRVSTVKIALARLVHSGTRGYSLITGVAPKPTPDLNPEHANGAGDQFPGEDFPSTVKVEATAA